MKKCLILLIMTVFCGCQNNTLLNTNPMPQVFRERGTLSWAQNQYDAVITKDDMGIVSIILLSDTLKEETVFTYDGESFNTKQGELSFESKDQDFLFSNIVITLYTALEELDTGKVDAKENTYEVKGNTATCIIDGKAKSPLKIKWNNGEFFVN